MAAWAAIIFDPLFGITDYFNIPNAWATIFAFRITIATITLLAYVVWREYNLPSFIIVVIPLVLISFQNAYTYQFIGNDQLLGHNLNYMALFIGAGMFLLWHWVYSVMALVLSIGATGYFVINNPSIDAEQFFVEGGLLLVSSGIFMTILIKTRYDLNVREIKARLALMESKQEIQEQAEKIRMMNDNLEALVRQRTIELERKNKALEEYAFINAHKLRAPVASILGLVHLLQKEPLPAHAKEILQHLDSSSANLNEVVESITIAIEKGERKI